eukprot:12303904-Alexandrium_andersonii.AAC.1
MCACCPAVAAYVIKPFPSQRVRSGHNRVSLWSRCGRGGCDRVTCVTAQLLRARSCCFCLSRRLCFQLDRVVFVAAPLR